MLLEGTHVFNNKFIEIKFNTKKFRMKKIDRNLTMPVFSVKCAMKKQQRILELPVLYQQHIFISD